MAFNVSDMLKFWGEGEEEVARRTLLEREVRAVPGAGAYGKSFINDRTAIITASMDNLKVALEALIVKDAGYKVKHEPYDWLAGNKGHRREKFLCRSVRVEDSTGAVLATVNVVALNSYGGGVDVYQGDPTDPTDGTRKRVWQGSMDFKVGLSKLDEQNIMSHLSRILPRSGVPCAKPSFFAPQA
ncbi:MAG: hypothetical protein HY053_02265 [Proteobacteria bacterium]|nr:hypothetical protein [Pseudomonadota bacterium]